MTIPMKPLSEVTSQAIRLLSEQLGVVDTIRFVNQFTNGHGDYTEERDTLFRDVSIDDVVSAIKKKQLRDRAATATVIPSNPNDRL